MIRKLAGGALITILAITIASPAVASAQEVGTIEFESTTEGAEWTDVAGEDSYRIFGNVVYLGPPSCGPDRFSLGSERIEFDETLPPDTTSFTFPGPTDQRLTWAKDGMVTLEALAADGSRIALNGSGWQADKFCTPEEIAAAGTGYAPPGNRVFIFALVGLLAFGVASLAAAAAFRRGS